MKKHFFLLLLYFTIIGIAQVSKNKSSFKEKIIQLKNKDNLENYFYAYFDEYLKTKDLSLLNNGIDSAWRNPINNDEETALLHLKINIAYYHFKKGAISKSLKAYENALYYYQKKYIKNYDIINYCLKPLANNYTRLGDFKRAEELYKYTLEIADKQNNSNALIGTYLNLAILFQNTNKSSEAITLLKKALKTKGLNQFQQNELKLEIAENYSLNSNFKKALLLVSKLPISHQSELIKAMCYFNTNQLVLAEKHINKAIVLLNSTTHSKREIVKTYNILAQIQVKRENLNSALKTYDKGLKLLINNNIKDNLYAENTLLEIFDGKANIFTKQKKYQKAIDNYLLAFKVEQLLQFTKSSQKAKIIQQQSNRNRSEKIISLYYELFINNPKTTLIKKAFKSAETSKASVLLEKLTYYNSIIKNQGDSLIKHKQNLEQKKSILSKNIRLEELKHKNANINIIKELTIKKTSITTQIEVLKQEINNKYPFLKNGLELVSINEIKNKLLNENQQLIEFFDTKKHVYVFSIIKNQPIQWYRINKNENYNNSLKTYIALFINNNGDNLKNEVSKYQKSAFYLYQILLQNVVSVKHNKITIIPDGKLNFVSFEALLTKNRPYKSFKNLSYLLYEKEINYGYSSNVLIQQKENNSKNFKHNNVIGFFPLFKNNYRKLQELTYTIEEKKALQILNNSVIYDKEKATKTQFLKSINNYKIIHLSTHASAGNFEEPAHIEFIDSTLYLPEIYGLNLNTKLIVLSACETGIGKLHKGEGTMSLARGFSYSGIKNLIVSQWKVNDKSTSLLFRKFYVYLNKSNNISHSLYQSKIDYLKDKTIPNLKKTPYYWSGFVFIGNTDNEIKSKNHLVLYLLGLIVFILIIFILRKNKATQNTS